MWVSYRGLGGVDPEVSPPFGYFTLGSAYKVAGVEIESNQIWLYVANDLDVNIPLRYHSSMFDILDGTIDRKWVIRGSADPVNNLKLKCGLPIIVDNNYYLDDVTNGDSEIIAALRDEFPVEEFLRALPSIAQAAPALERAKEILAVMGRSWVEALSAARIQSQMLCHISGDMWHAELYVDDNAPRLPLGVTNPLPGGLYVYGESAEPVAEMHVYHANGLIKFLDIVRYDAEDLFYYPTAADVEDIDR